MNTKRLRCINRPSGYLEMKSSLKYTIYYGPSATQTTLTAYLKKCNLPMNVNHQMVHELDRKEFAYTTEEVYSFA